MSAGVLQGLHVTISERVRISRVKANYKTNRVEALLVVANLRNNDKEPRSLRGEKINDLGYYSLRRGCKNDIIYVKRRLSYLLPCNPRNDRKREKH